MSRMPQGPLESEWRATIGRRIGYAFLLLFFPGALGLLMLANDPGIRLIGQIALAGTAALIVFMFWFQAGIVVRVHADGVARHGRFAAKAVLWEDLVAYRVALFDQSMATAGHVGGLVGILVLAAVRSASKSGGVGKTVGVTLVGKDGSKLRITGALQRGQELAEMLGRFATERMLPGAMALYEAGQPVWFGKRMSVRRGEGVVTKGTFGGHKVLPFHEVDRSGFEGAAFVVRKTGQRRAWLSLPVMVVDNPMVAERLILHASSQASLGVGQIPTAYVVK